jgi:mRNA-degrading endonuclease toxin of MazEF toxin-antitoxin module
LSGGKVRPAIVVNSAEFQAVEQLYIVAAVTSNVTASSPGHRIVDATSAGLKVPRLNTHIVTTDRWDQMRRWAATLWQQVQRDGVPLLPESTLV